MMFKELFDRLQESKIPEINRDIAEGIVYKDVDAVAAVDRIWEAAEKALPENFHYLGSRLCNPMEAYRVLAGVNDPNPQPEYRFYDMAPSDLYLVRYKFQLGEDRLRDRYQLLPEFNRGSLLTLGDKTFAASPVIGDTIFSVGEDNVFVRLTSVQFTFYRHISHYILDGRRDNQTMPWSKIHQRGARTRVDSDRLTMNRVVTNIPHYLFARFGLIEAFKKYANADIILTRSKDIVELERDGLDLSQYHQACSFGTKPVGFKENINYDLIASDLIILIPKGQMTPMVRKFLVSFFYVIDFYPENNDPEEVVSDFFWQHMLGLFLFGDSQGVGKLVENVVTHLSSTDAYVNQEAKAELYDEYDVDVDDFYDLCAYLTKHLDEMIDSSDNEIGSMYGKTLMSTQYILKDIFESIFKAVYSVNNNRKREHTKADYDKNFGKNIKHAKITDLRRTSEKPFISTVNLPNSNLLFKLGINAVQQSRTMSKGVRSRQINPAERINHSNASTLECGNIQMLPKSSPLASSTINPCVKLSPKRKLLRKRHLIEAIEHAATYVARD